MMYCAHGNLLRDACLGRNHVSLFIDVEDCASLFGHVPFDVFFGSGVQRPELDKDDLEGL